MTYPFSMISYDALCAAAADSDADNPLLISHMGRRYVIYLDQDVLRITAHCAGIGGYTLSQQLFAALNLGQSELCSTGKTLVMG